MSLEPGRCLGHYEIIAPIGAGGMGEAYKARDPRLNRVVAIKVLLERLCDQPEARARFEREAQTLASLNHPHICVVHDVGRDGDTDFIVMELLEGETLARRLERGALSLDHAVQHVIEIADALDKAHRHGVTHRDLKPGNIMLTKSGVKLLDFGLAKLRQPENVSSFSEAITGADMTAEGTILGSLHYMAPEQVEGREADARTDIFAFGTVLYEMVTGQKAFEGKSAVSVMSAILKDIPKPVSALLPAAPPALDRLVAACLEKEPDDRWQTARDLWRELKWIRTSSSETGPHKSIGTRAAGEGTRRAIPWSLSVLIALTGAILAGIGTWMLKSGAPTGSEIVRLSVALPVGDGLLASKMTALALSPDGTQLAYVGRRGDTTPQVYVRAMNSLETKPISGTDGAYSLFFSPDNQWVGFFAQNKLKKVSVSGGAPVDLCDAPLAVGGSWAPDDTIYFAPDVGSGLKKVSASGGPCEEVTRVDRKNELSHRWPQVLPGGKALLYTVKKGFGWDESVLQTYVFGTGESRAIAQGASTGRYVRSGHVIYSRAGNLVAIPFDLGTLSPTGPSVALTEFVRESFEGAQYDVSDSGSVAYVPGHSAASRRRLVWVDRKGTVEPLPVEPRTYGRPVISPDGRNVAIDIVEATSGVWIYDFSRGALSAFTSLSHFPIWTHDAKRIIFTASYRNLLWKAADGSGGEEALTSSDNIGVPGSVTPDGKWLAFHAVDPATGPDIWVLPLDGDRKPQVVVKTPEPDISPRFSPDGRWLAYATQSGPRPHVYVTPFPGPGGRSQISTDGGAEPIWSRTGRELFYRNGSKMMAVDIVTQPTFSAGAPRQLFDGRFEFGTAGLAGYDVAPDGRFLMVQPVEPEQAARQINIVLNWFEELKQRAPAGTR